VEISPIDLQQILFKFIEIDGRASLWHYVNSALFRISIANNGIFREL